MHYTGRDFTPVTVICQQQLLALYGRQYLVHASLIARRIGFIMGTEIYPGTRFKTRNPDTCLIPGTMDVLAFLVKVSNFLR